jgi:very-short-patch-repair endonuclease
VDMPRKVDTPDARVARLAEKQHGVVAVGQLGGLGLSEASLRGRVAAGRFHPLHRGVYGVGHRPFTFEGRCMAAALACGDGAVVSRRSAAAVWGLLDPHDGDIHLSIPGRNGRALREGIALHRCPSLTVEQVTRQHGIPVTTAARTLADLRREGPAMAWRRAVRQAEVLGLRTGIPLRAPTRSELEDRFLRLCRRHKIPKPEVNERIEGFEVDFLWRQARLVVETDGFVFHRGPSHFESDRHRDLELRRLGYDVIRLSYSQVTEKPRQVSASLRAALI